MAIENNDNEAVSVEVVVDMYNVGPSALPVLPEKPYMVCDSLSLYNKRAPVFIAAYLEVKYIRKLSLLGAAYLSW